MIELAGDRRVLYQWELDRRITLDGFPAGTRVEFSSKYDSKESALTVAAYAEGDEVYADIPNALLQHDGYIRALVRPSANEAAHDPCMKDIRVIRREKPEDYVYSETSVLTYESLEERVAKLEGEGLGQAIADYLAKNPVLGTPPGGKAGQFLCKKSDEDYDVEWADFKIPEQYGLVTYDQDKTITIT